MLAKIQYFINTTCNFGTITIFKVRYGTLRHDYIGSKVVLLQRHCFVNQPLGVRFNFLNFDLEFLKTWKYFAAQYKNTSNPLILRRTACMDTFLPF
jgi:hypothetical protein